MTTPITLTEEELDAAFRALGRALAFSDSEWNDAFKGAQPKMDGRGVDSRGRGQLNEIRALIVAGRDLSDAEFEIIRNCARVPNRQATLPEARATAALLARLAWFGQS